MVFIGSHSHKFSAVSMATGNAKWEITLGDRIESSACMSRCGNYVIVGKTCFIQSCRVDSSNLAVSWAR